METRPHSELVQIGPYVWPEQKKLLALVSVEKGISQSEIMQQAFDEWIKKHRK